MRWVWAGAAVLCMAMVGSAHADTIYLKDGQVLWGKDVVEEGDRVILIRPAGPLEFPRGQVERIERAKISLPRFYSVPAAEPSAPAATATREPAGAQTGTPATTATPPPPSPPPTSLPTPAPGGSGAPPAELPPVPPPPALPQ